MCDLDPLLYTCSIAASHTNVINWRLLRHIFTTPVIYNCVQSNLKVESYKLTVTKVLLQTLEYRKAMIDIGTSAATIFQPKLYIFGNRGLDHCSPQV